MSRLILIFFLMVSPFSAGASEDPQANASPGDRNRLATGSADKDCGLGFGGADNRDRDQDAKLEETRKNSENLERSRGSTEGTQ